MSKVSEAYEAMGLKKEYKQAKKWAKTLNKTLEDAGISEYVEIKPFVEVAAPTASLYVDGVEIARAPAPIATKVGEMEAEKMSKIFATEIAKIASAALTKSFVPAQEDIEESFADDEPDLDY